MVVAAGREAGSSKILFTIHAGVVRRALCRSVAVGRPVRLASRSRAMRANERARCQISKEGKIAFLSSLPSLSHAPLRPTERSGAAAAANAKLPPLLHSDLRSGITDAGRGAPFAFVRRLEFDLKLEREIFCALMRALRYSFMFIT